MIATWINRVIGAVADCHDHHDLWKHLKDDPDAFRNAVIHATRDMFTASTVTLSAVQRRELASVPGLIRELYERSEGTGPLAPGDSRDVVIGAIEQILAAAEASGPVPVMFDDMSLADDILKMVHAFPDQDRKNRVREMAARANDLEKVIVAARAVQHAMRHIESAHSYQREARKELADALAALDAEDDK